MKTAVIYARYSSNRQTEMSIDAQVRACNSYAEQRGFIIQDEYIDEAISGKSTKNRSGYQRMMRDAEKGLFDVILIHKYDRISRNLGDSVNLQAKLQQLEIELIAVSQDFGDSKEGRLMKGIQYVLGDYYVENLAEETRKGHKEIAVRGMHNGGVAPFGYDIVDQKYEINEIEANYVRRMFYCAKNKLSYKELLDTMDANGIVGKRGKKLTYSSIHEILRNEKYTGTYVYSEFEEKNRSDRRSKPNAIRIEDAFPSIISRDEWEEVQKAVDERKQNEARGKYRCSGLVYCGKCGSKMHVVKSKNKGHIYYYFNCSQHCGQRVVRVEAIDKMLDMFIEELNRPKLREDFKDMMNEFAKDEERANALFEEERAERLEEKQIELDNLTSYMASEKLPDIVLKTVSDKIVSINEDIKRIKKNKPLKVYTMDTINGWMDSVLKASDQELPKILVEKIVVTDDTVEITSMLHQLLEKLKKPTTEDGCGSTVVAGVRVEANLRRIRHLFSMTFNVQEIMERN